MFRYLKKHSSQIVTGYTLLMLLMMAFEPECSHYTRWAFTAYWSAAGSDTQRWLIVLALLVLLSGVALNNTLQKFDMRWLEWSPFSKKANAIYGPLHHKRLGWLYAALLLFCMPLLALIEEVIFRYAAGQFGLVVLLVVSGPVFGLVHISSGVSVRMSLYLSLVGLAMAGIYLGTGLLGVFVFHASYNLIAISFVLFELRVREPLGELLNRYTSTRRQLPTITAWLLKPGSSAIN